MVTCPLGDRDADEAFRLAHRHLYYRLCRLADNVMGYFLRRDAHMIIPESASRDGVPRFVSVAFDEKADRAFEARTEKILGGRRYARELPRPDFPVRLEVQFAHGGRETFLFDFAQDPDDAIEAFCIAVCEAARDGFRRRFHGGG